MTTVVVIGLFLLAAVRLKPLLRKGTDDVFMAAMCAGIGMGINIDRIYLWLDPILGGTNLANLICHVFVIVGLWFLRSSILGAVSPEAGGTYRLRSVLPVTVTLVAHAVLFYLSDLPVTAPDFNAVYSGQATVAMYTCLTMAYIAWVSAETATACLRYVPQMRGAFRAGFTVLGAGCAAAMIAAVAQVIFVMGQHFNPLEPLAGMTAFLYESGQILSVLLIAVGLTIPPVAAAVSRWRKNSWYRQVNRTMTGIWDELREAANERQTMPLGNITGSELTYRLLVEVRDSQLLAGDDSPLTEDQLTYIDDVERRLNVAHAG